MSGRKKYDSDSTNDLTMLTRRFRLPALQWILLIFVTACGSPPTIRDSKLLTQHAVKIDNISFAYKHSELKVTPLSPGKSIVYSENGYPDFGQKLVKMAPSVFERAGLKLTDARKIGANEAINVTNATFLLLYASNGRISANANHNSMTLMFQALLFDPSTRRVIWRATVDTSTWRGKGFINGGAKSTLYDESYAELLLQALVSEMKKDALI